MTVLDSTKRPIWDQIYEVGEWPPKMLEIDGTYIPAVNVQIDGFPRTINGEHYFEYFEIMFEIEDYYWVIERIGEVILTVYFPDGEYFKMTFPDWVAFRDHYLEHHLDEVPTERL